MRWRFASIKDPVMSSGSAVPRWPLLFILVVSACQKSAGTGSGLPSGGAGAGGSPANCEGHPFCDDFEAAAPGATPSEAWQLDLGAGASLVVDGTRRASGRQSVRIQAPSAGKAWMAIEGKPVFPLKDNTLFGRMLVFLEAAPSETTNWNIIMAEGLVSGSNAFSDYRAEYRYGGQHPVEGGSRLKANYETPDWYDDTAKSPGSDCWQHAGEGDVMPVGRWACFEWKFTGPENRMEMWIDGRAIESLTVDGHGEGCVNAAADFTWTAPTFERINLGWRAFQAHAPVTLYIDDVVLSDRAIGCPDVP